MSEYIWGRVFQARGEAGTKALRQKHTCWVPGMTGPPGIRGQNGKWEWRTQKGLEHNNRRWVSMYNQN